MYKLSLIYFIISAILKYSASFLTNNKQNVIESLCAQLNIKHLNIMKDSNFQVDSKILWFVKRLSQQKIYTSALSVTQIIDSLYDYYYTSPENLNEATITGNKDLIDKKKANWVYPPKTMVLLHGENLEEITYQLFTIDENLVTKWTWLITDNFYESYLNDYYLPYNSELLLLKETRKEKNEYFIEEFYHPSFFSIFCFNRHFGIWEPNKGLKIFEPDIYKRRLDFNGTLLVAYYDEGYKSFFSDNCEDSLMTCQLVYEIARIINCKLILAVYDENNNLPYEISHETYVLSHVGYNPYFIGPVGKEGNNFYIAYDKEFEQHHITKFLRPYSFELWMAVVAWIAVSMIALIINYYFYNKENNQIYFWDYLYEPLESFLNQCGQSSPKRFSLMIVTAATRLAALFLVPGYTGAILSFILNPILKLPFKNIEEFVKDGSYRFGYIKISDIDIYVEGTNDFYLKTAFEKFSAPLTGTHEDAVNYGMKLTCENHKFAILSSKLPSKYFSCQTHKISSRIFEGYEIIQIRYSSPYMQLFNRILRTAKSSGVFKRMRNVEDESLGISPFLKDANLQTDDDDSLEINNFVPLFTTVGILYIISVILLFAEIIFTKVKNQLPLGDPFR